MVEPGEYSDNSREKLEELRHKSDEARKRKARERRERLIAEEERAHDPAKFIAPLLFGILAVILLVGFYLFVDSMEIDQSGLMLSNSAFKEASAKVKEHPEVINASFYQELKSVEQIEVKLYIDYVVLDEQAREIGNEVMVMLTTPEEGDTEIEEDEVGSSRYRYQVIMLRLDNREVARGVMAAGAPRVEWVQGRE
jgi:hypothetical protein